MGKFVTTDKLVRPTTNFHIRNGISDDLKRPYSLFVEEIMFAINEQRIFYDMDEFQFFIYDRPELDEDGKPIIPPGFELDLDEDVIRKPFTPTAPFDQMIGTWAFVDSYIHDIAKAAGLNPILTTPDVNDPLQMGLFYFWGLGNVSFDDDNSAFDGIVERTVEELTTGIEPKFDNNLNTLIPKLTFACLFTDRIKIYDFGNAMLQASDNQGPNDENIVNEWLLRDEDHDLIAQEAVWMRVFTGSIYVLFSNGIIRRYNGSDGRVTSTSAAILPVPDDFIPEGDKFIVVRSGKIFEIDDLGVEENEFEVFFNRDAVLKITGYTSSDFFPNHFPTFEPKTQLPPIIDGILQTGTENLAGRNNSLIKPFMDIIVGNEILTCDRFDFSETSGGGQLTILHSTEITGEATLRGIGIDTKPSGLNFYVNTFGKSPFPRTVGDGAGGIYPQTNHIFLPSGKNKNLHMRSPALFQFGAFVHTITFDLITEDVIGETFFGGSGFTTFQKDRTDPEFKDSFFPDSFIEGRAVFGIPIDSWGDIENTHSAVADIYIMGGYWANELPGTPSRTFNVNVFTGNVPLSGDAETQFNSVGTLLGSFSLPSASSIGGALNTNPVFVLRAVDLTEHVREDGQLWLIFIPSIELVDSGLRFGQTNLLIRSGLGFAVTLGIRFGLDWNA